MKALDLMIGHRWVEEYERLYSISPNGEVYSYTHKERLPKCYTIPSTEQYIKNRRYWNNKVAPIYLVICSDPQGNYYYQFANFIKFPEDKKPCWVFVEDNIKRNCGTHWMLIPKVNKEK